MFLIYIILVCRPVSLKYGAPDATSSTSCAIGVPCGLAASVIKKIAETVLLKSLCAILFRFAGLLLCSLLALLIFTACHAGWLLGIRFLFSYFSALVFSACHRDWGRKWHAIVQKSLILLPAESRRATRFRRDSEVPDVTQM